MRFLPYALVALMAMPAVVWTVLEVFVLPTQATPFASLDLLKMSSLAMLALPAMGLLAWWMSRQIAEQRAATSPVRLRRDEGLRN